MREWNESLRFNGREELIKTLRGICKEYGDIFDFVVLFGSTARGDCLDSSDIDLYIESNTLTTTKLLKQKLYRDFEHSLFDLTDIEIDFISVGRNELKTSRSSFLYEQLEKDGVILYDKRREII